MHTPHTYATHAHQEIWKCEECSNCYKEEVDSKAERTIKSSSPWVWEKDDPQLPRDTNNIYRLFCYGKRCYWLLVSKGWKCCSTVCDVNPQGKITWPAIITGMTQNNSDQEVSGLKAPSFGEWVYASVQS